MTFLNAAFLAGLAAIAVPVVLHLIHRQRYPERRFTALRFFDVTIKHNVVQRRLIDRLLLALRVLALLALAAGLARPFWAGRVGEQRASLAIVLDNSPSMGRSADGRTLFDAAQDTVRRTLAALGPADRAALVLTAGTPAPPATLGHAAPELTADRAALAAALAAAQLSAEPGRLADALAAATRLLQGSADGDKRLVLVSDMQAAEWNGAIAGLKGTSVVVARVEPATAATRNLSIEDCTPGVREAGLGQTVLATATVRNNGPEPVRDAKLVVTAGPRGKPTELKLAAIPAASALRVSFPVLAMARERNLPCSVEVRAPSDSLTYDDTWHFLVGVRPPATVLCVNGVPDAAPTQRESFFVMSALGLPGTSGRAETRIDVTEAEPDALETASLFQYRVLVLAGVDKLGEPARARLRSFVDDGGGLLVFPGRDALADEYNGWGFLPARVVATRVDAFTCLRTLSDRAAAVSDVAERLGAGAALLTTRRWLKLEPTAGAEVLAGFTGGEPALVEGAVGRGRVILAAAGCHTADSDWPLRAAFPILLHALVNHLGAPAQPLRMVREIPAGAGAACTIPSELAAGTAGAFRAVSRDGQATWDTQPAQRHGRFLVLPTARVPGQYVLSVGPAPAPGQAGPGVGAAVVHVAVNHAASESPLAPLKPDRLPALLPDATVTDLTAGDNVAPILAGLYSGRDLWRVLLVVALAALVAESLLGWRAPSQSME